MSGKAVVKDYIEQNALWGTKEILRIPRPQASPRLIEYNNGFRAHMQNFFSKSTDKEAKQAYSENATLKDVQEEATEALKKYKSDGRAGDIHSRLRAGPSATSIMDQ
ncbi:hypothetical protein V8E54_004722 [Elaphomyces granulatus]